MTLIARIARALFSSASRCTKCRTACPPEALTLVDASGWHSDYFCPHCASQPH